MSKDQVCVGGAGFPMGKGSPKVLESTNVKKKKKKSKALGQVDLSSNTRAVGPMATPLSFSMPICKMDIKDLHFRIIVRIKGDNFRGRIWSHVWHMVGTEK